MGKDMQAGRCAGRSPVRPCAQHAVGCALYGCRADASLLRPQRTVPSRAHRALSQRALTARHARQRAAPHLLGRAASARALRPARPRGRLAVLTRHDGRAARSEFLERGARPAAVVGIVRDLACARTLADGACGVTSRPSRPGRHNAISCAHTSTGRVHMAGRHAAGVQHTRLESSWSRRRAYCILVWAPMPKFSLLLPNTTVLASSCRGFQRLSTCLCPCLCTSYRYAYVLG